VEGEAHTQHHRCRATSLEKDFFPASSEFFVFLSKAKASGPPAAGAGGGRGDLEQGRVSHVTVQAGEVLLQQGEGEPALECCYELLHGNDNLLLGSLPSSSFPLFCSVSCLFGAVFCLHETLVGTVCRLKTCFFVFLQSFSSPLSGIS